MIIWSLLMSTPRTFLHQENREMRAYEKKKEQARDFHNQWASPNYSKYGYGWRGCVLNDDRQEYMMETPYIRKMNHPAIFHPEYRHNLKIMAGKTFNLLGGPHTSGEPYMSKPEVPE